jgi:hypothetical protein
MGAELEKIFSLEVLEAFDERVRAIVRKTQATPGAGGDCWLTTRQAAERASASEWTIRKLARLGLLEKYQPNPGRAPLRVKKSSLLSLDKAVIESAAPARKTKKDKK